jgi:hypothetical protein
MRFLTILNNAWQSVERIDFVDFFNGSFRARILSGTLTADRTLTAPNQSGTIAVVSDLMAPNLFINGNFNIVQGVAGSIVAGTSLPTASLGYAPLQNNWFNYSIGGNPTVAQIAGSGTALNRLQLTGVAGVTAIGVGQRIESINAAQLAGQIATLSIDLANSLGLPVTWTAFHPSTTADTFGTIASPTKTQIATGTFAATSALTRFSASFACPENVRRGIEIILSVGSQTSGTWVIGNAKLEAGTTATAFVSPDAASELDKCLRVYEVVSVMVRGYAIASGVIGTYLPYSVRKRIDPTAVFITQTETINVSSILVNNVNNDGFRYLLIASATGEASSWGTYSFSSQIP